MYDISTCRLTESQFVVVVVEQVPSSPTRKSDLADTSRCPHTNCTHHGRLFVVLPSENRTNFVDHNKDENLFYNYDKKYTIKHNNNISMSPRISAHAACLKDGEGIIV